MWVPRGYTHRRYRARIDSAGDGFEWLDQGQGPGAMLIIALPLNYSFVYSIEYSPDPIPVRFKLTGDGRLALYWWLPHGRFSVKWRMKESLDTDLETEFLLLNEKARQTQPSFIPVHIDRPLGQYVNVPSYQPPLISQPPAWNVANFINVTQEKVIHIGNNNTLTAPITIADQIENSFNLLARSETGPDLKQLLEQLLNQVNEISKAISKEDAESMARDAESLSKEVTSSKPRRKWYEISIEGLKQAALNIGEIGKPLLETVAKLLPLLHALNP